MTLVEQTSSSSVVDGHGTMSWRSVDRWLERLGDRLNPILVKEARQAMKSRQFTVTFSLLLICGWAWSLIGVAMQMPGIYYAPTGLFMLTGYYVILAVPLLLIVPFSAFRSLAGEREDGTYELLSISTLSARQIVTGKLGSAMLQMLVYYSALAPCIAFTYLLRGVDIITIFLGLFYTFLASVLLSTVGLVFAGVSRSRLLQPLLSVALLLLLVCFGFMWLAFFVQVIEQLDDIPLSDRNFWIAQAALITAYGTYLTLLISIASAQNSFPSDNRSTKLRIAILVQSSLFAGWVAYGWSVIRDHEFLLVMLMAAAIHWYVYGAFMTGESPILSPRVKRELPRSFLGRGFLTWFNPGSGTGFVFAVATFGVLVALILAAVAVQREFGIPAARFSRATTVDRTLLAGLLVFGYFVSYLGGTRLLIVFIPHRHRYGLLLPFLLHVLVLLAGCAVPFFVEAWMNRFVRIDYTPLQVTNWLWTIVEVFDGGMTFIEVPLAVTVSAGVIFVVNLALAASEVEQTRIDAPQRVLEDDSDRRASRSFASPAEG